MLVVGGMSGIGRACVRLFAEHGGRVGFTYHESREAATRMVKQSGPGAKLKAWNVNLESDESMKLLATSVASHFERLDGLVMCQGVIEGKRLQSYSFSSMKRVLDINVLSIIKLTKLLQGLMAENSTMTFLTSISAHTGSYDPVYAASKGAIISFAKSMAEDYGPKTRVNCVAPALTHDTGMYDQMQEDIRRGHESATLLKRLASPADIANAVLFLSSESSRHMTGVCIDVNGGEYLR